MARLFVALALPPEVQEQLLELCHGLPGARWLLTAPFHLTLAFLGEVDGPVVRRVEEGLYGVRADPFELAVAGVGHFPPRGEPRVLWAGVAPKEPVQTLRDAVHRRLKKVGVSAEQRRFAPHITLARLKQTPLDQLLEWMRRQLELASELFPVTHFELLESTLGRGGARHRVLASYPLMSREGL